jgi:hypothetical protein
MSAKRKSITDDESGNKWESKELDYEHERCFLLSLVAPESDATCVDVRVVKAKTHKTEVYHVHAPSDTMMYDIVDKVRMDSGIADCIVTIWEKRCKYPIQYDNDALDIGLESFIRDLRYDVIVLNETQDRDTAIRMDRDLVAQGIKVEVCGNPNHFKAAVGMATLSEQMRQFCTLKNDV